MLNEVEENGRIERTQLGPGDDGLESFWIMLAFEGSGQGFGGYRLGGAFTDYVVKGVLMAANATQWEKLVGRYVRVRREGDSIIAIGNIQNDPLRSRVKDGEWFTPRDFKAKANG